MCEEIPAGMGLALCEMHNTDEIVSVRGGLPSEWPALPLSQVEVSPDELLTPSFSTIATRVATVSLLLATLLLRSNSVPPSPLAKQTREIGFRAGKEPLLPRFPRSARVGA